MTSPTLLLIDGHSLAFRAYYAFAKGRDGGLRTATGIPTNICFGFLKSLVQVTDALKPKAIAVTFDLGGPTFRHEADTEYKAGREEPPDDFKPDLENLLLLLKALNLQTAVAPGYEADDVLGTLAQQGAEAGYAVKILSGDRDLFQLVDDERQISVLYMDHRALKSKAGGVEYHEAEVVEKLGVRADQVVDFKALCGDKSDNIPGVKGIGEKTAVKLLAKYQTLAAVYDNVEKITGANQKKLKAGEAAAQHSQFLAQIKLDVELDLTIADFELQGFEEAAVRSQLETLELKNFIKQIDRLQSHFGGQGAIPETAASPDEIGLPDTEDVWFFSYEDTLAAQAQVQAQVKIQPQITDTPEKLDALLAELQQHTDPNQPVAWDTETSDLDPYKAILVGLGCCWGPEPEAIAYIPLAHSEGIQLERDAVMTALKEILASPDYPKVFQNTKFDRLILQQQGLELAGVTFDPMLASYVLDPTGSHNLTDLSLRYLDGVESLSYKDLNIPKGKTIADLPIPQVANYCGLDAYATFMLVQPLQAELAQLPALQTLLETVEMPLESVLADMERVGICIDVPYLQTLSTQLEAQLQEIEQQAYAAAGAEFNLGSPKQLSELFFTTLGLSTKKSRKTKTGYSTDHATLEKLQGDHPIIDHILEHRTLAKLKSTYVDALPSLVNQHTQRIHTDFNQAVTATGRLSSSNPNLQNIPVRSEFSRQIRQAFIPQTGWTLIAADYSQIELRILAHLSQEQVLVEAYQQGEDVHTVTARLVFDKAEVTPDERRLGKTINFGVIYGMGAQRFAREAGVSSKEGKAFIDRYRERYAQVFNYLELQKRTAIAQGYVETIMQRRRHFNFVGESVRSLRGKSAAEIDLRSLKRLSQGDAQLLRAAANAPIQGSSADIIKVAMVKLQPILANYQANLLLQVHDELIFEAPPEEVDTLSAQIRTTMEQAVQLAVPLTVELHTGANWMAAK
ncbi:MAG: DNA polymerase I [Spirulina sp. SIO3F2]|nr:DNA polymerase I [Spirulina sp. SIO3F2]